VQPARQQAYPSGVFKINETPVVFVAKGTPYLVVAQQHRVSLARLFEFNDLERSEETPADMLLYLQRKRKSGATEFYTVAEGETVHDIAQATGIRLESLMEYNLLTKGMQPAAGEKLYLKHKAPVAPRTAGKTAFTAPVHEADVYLVHTVQAKETVYAIARKYDVSINEIMQWNNLEKQDIKIGQQLRINKKAGYALN